MAEISFKTEEGAQEAADRVYSEFLVPCLATTSDGSEAVFYISRGYNPYQVFVWIRNPLNMQIYLQNLSTGVSLAHELYNFGNVEI